MTLTPEQRAARLRAAQAFRQVASHANRLSGLARTHAAAIAGIRRDVPTILQTTRDLVKALTNARMEGAAHLLATVETHAIGGGQVHIRADVAQQHLALESAARHYDAAKAAAENAAMELEREARAP